jgi:hypothetical protein
MVSFDVSPHLISDLRYFLKMKYQVSQPYRTDKRTILQIVYVEVFKRLFAFRLWYFILCHSVLLQKWFTMNTEEVGSVEILVITLKNTLCDNR